MKSVVLALAAVVSTVAIASASQAAILGFEPFDYPNGTPIIGQSGGTGWMVNSSTKGSWFSVGDPSPTVVNSQLVTGNAGGGNAAARDIGGNNAAIPGTGVVYFAADLNFDPGTRFAGLSWYDYGNEREFFGIPFDTGVFGLDGERTGRQLSSVQALPNTDYRLVARVDYTNQNVALWVNPTTADEGAPTISSGINSGNYFTAIRVASGGGEANVGARWDNLTLADTFADAVTGVVVPEPSGLALLPLAGLALRRRR